MSILPKLLAWVKTVSFASQLRLISSSNVLYVSEDPGIAQFHALRQKPQLEPSRPRLWTDDEQDTLRRAMKDGLMKSQIEALLPGRTWRAITQRRLQLEGRPISSSNVLKVSKDPGNAYYGAPPTKPQLWPSRRRPWTDEEKETLRQGITNGMKYREIAALLPGRSMKILAQRVYQLDGVDAGRHGRRPLHPDTKLIAALAARGLTPEEIQVHVPHIAIKNIRERARVRGATYTRQKPRRQKMKHWTEAEDEILLRGMDAKLPPQVMIDQLPGRTVTALESRLHELRRAVAVGCPVRGSRGLWTAEEVQKLETWYGNGKPIAEIGYLLGRTVLSVRAGIRKLRRRQAQAKPDDSGAE